MIVATLGDGIPEDNEAEHGPFATPQQWAASLTDEQVDALKSTLGLRQKLQLLQLSHEQDPQVITQRAANFVSTLAPEQRQAIRQIITPEQQHGFAALTTISI